MCDIMELSATEVLPTVKVINRLIFMPSPSVAACMLAIARPRDFVMSPKMYSLFPLPSQNNE